MQCSLLSIFLTLVFLTIKAAGQGPASCQGSIVRTLDQLATFKACKHINGSLVITGSSWPSLFVLSDYVGGIEEVSVDFQIFGITSNQLSLGNMAMKTIGGSLVLHQSYLTSTEGFSLLTEVGGDLVITETNVTSIRGFNNLTSVWGRLFFTSNDNLTTIESFPELRDVGGVYCYSNNLLTSIGAFSKWFNQTGNFNGCSTGLCDVELRYNALLDARDILFLDAIQRVQGALAICISGDYTGLPNLVFVQTIFTICLTTEAVSFDGAPNLVSAQALEISSLEYDPPVKLGNLRLQSLRLLDSFGVDAGGISLVSLQCASFVFPKLVRGTTWVTQPITMLNSISCDTIYLPQLENLYQFYGESSNLTLDSLVNISGLVGLALTLNQESFSLPRLVNATGILITGGNVSNLSFPSLTRVFDKGLNISGNPNLKSISMPLLENVTAGPFIIADNPLLEDIGEYPNLGPSPNSDATIDGPDITICQSVVNQLKAAFKYIEFTVGLIVQC